MNILSHSLPALALALGLGLTGAAAAAEVEVRFHPDKQVWAHQLEAARNLGSVVLPNTAVVNRGQAPVTVAQVRYDVVRGGEVVVSRLLGARDLDALAGRGDALARSGMLSLLDFQFAPARLFGEGVEVAAARTLAPGKALYVPTQLLAFAGQPDRVRVTVEFEGDDTDAIGTLSIRHGSAPGHFRFPVEGRWFLAAGSTPHSHHRWVVPEEFALDLVRIGEGGRTHRGDGARMQDYYAYGAPVLAVADGEVVAVLESVPDNVGMLRRKDEALADYQRRVIEGQGAMLAAGVLAGNYVILRHSEDVHSVYGHLAPDSVPVAVGDRVRAGQRIGALGGSGNSTEPHLHFQLCDAPSALQCAGMPVQFDNIELPYSDYPRQIQTGDLIDATRAGSSDTGSSPAK